MPSESTTGPDFRTTAPPVCLAGAWLCWQRRLAQRWAVRICRIKGARGRWSAQVEAATVPQAALAARPRYGAGVARAVGEGPTLPLALAAAVAELAQQSGIGLALFARRPLQRCGDRPQRATAR